MAFWSVWSASVLGIAALMAVKEPSIARARIAFHMSDLCYGFLFSLGMWFALMAGRGCAILLEALLFRVLPFSKNPSEGNEADR